MLNTKNAPVQSAHIRDAVSAADVVYYKLTKADVPAIRAHLLRLDPETRHMRFCASAGDAFIEKHVDELDWSSMIMFGAFVDGELRGVAEIVRVRLMPQTTAEIALSVEPAFQNAGIGTELLRRLLTAARNRYIQRVYMLCLSENRKMQRIARKFDANLLRDAGEVEGRIWPNWPSYGSLMEEIISDGWSFLHAVFDPTKVDDHNDVATVSASIPVDTPDTGIYKP